LTPRISRPVRRRGFGDGFCGDAFKSEDFFRRPDFDFEIRGAVGNFLRRKFCDRGLGS